MARSEEQRKRLRDAAEQYISGKQMKLADEETTGFETKSAPEICAVVVDRGSDVGYVGIRGGGKNFEKIDTGPAHATYDYRDISEGQSCTLIGSTVLFIYANDQP